MEAFKYYGGNHHHHPNHDIQQRIIIDTEGSIDDALAILIFLFAETVGLVRIEAITASPGLTNQTNVQNNIMRILEAAERTDIPVYAGTDSSFIAPVVGPPGPYGVDDFGDIPWDTQPDISGIIHKPAAAIAMGKLVTDNPGEISILGMAPSTNVALAAKLFPTFVDDVKIFHMSGGNYKAIGSFTWAAEYDFYLDPEAAYILLDKAIGKKLVNLVTWESVYESSISLDWRWDVLGAIDNPILKILEQAERKIYPSTSPVYNPLDAIAAACFLYPEEMIAKQEILPVSVELHGSQTRGQVVVNHFNNTTPNANIIKSIHQEFFQVLLKYAVTSTEKSFEIKKKLKTT